jgi:fatty-acyl-CoA synthase
MYDPILMPELLATALSRYDDRVAVQLGDEVVTYRGYREAVSRWAQAYRAAGLGPGRPVAVLARNRVEVLYNMGASSMTGCRGTPLHPLGSLDDHAYVLGNAGIDTLVFDPAFEEHVVKLREHAPGLRLLSFGPSRTGEDVIALAAQFAPGPLEPVRPRPDDVASMSFTGGTTGRPKGVIGTYRATASLTQIQMAEWQWPQEVRFLVCAPLSHAAAAFTLPVLLKGGSFVVMPGFSPQGWLAAVEEHRITATMIVPAMLYAILDHPDLATRDTSSLETVFYGTAVTSPARMAQAIERFGPVFF